MQWSAGAFLEDDESKAGKEALVGSARQVWLNLCEVCRLCPPRHRRLALALHPCDPVLPLLRSASLSRLRPPRHQRIKPPFINSFFFILPFLLRCYPASAALPLLQRHRYGRIEFHGEEVRVRPARHAARGGGGHLRRQVQVSRAAGATPHRLLPQGLRLAHGVASARPAHHLRPQVAEQHAAGRSPYPLPIPLLAASAPPPFIPYNNALYAVPHLLSTIRSDAAADGDTRAPHVLSGVPTAG